MTIARYHYKVTLCVRAPFLFPGLHSGALGVDATALRDLKNRPLIPGDQLRGVLKEALGDLPPAIFPAEDVPEAADSPEDNKTKFLARLFGQKSQKEEHEGADNSPQRGQIFIRDLCASRMMRDPDATRPTITDLCQEGLHTRIAIDPKTGAVTEGALQMVALVAPMGAGVLFEGSLTLFAPEVFQDRITDVLKKALALIGSIGAMKTPGFGEVLQAQSALTLESCVALRTITAPAAAEGQRYRLNVTFDRPILVDSTKMAENVVASAAVIPGAAFKGALACRLLRDTPEALSVDGDIGRALDGLSFSHAWPLNAKGQRLNVPLPLSLIAAETAQGILVGDALSLADGAGALLGNKPALFSGDWKDHIWPEAAEKAGWPQGACAPLLPRTHTAIHPESGTALDEMLFTTLLRSETYWDENDQTVKAQSWQLEVDASLMAQEDQPWGEALIALLQKEGLDGFGGTGARASFALASEDAVMPPEPTPIYGKEHHYAVMLETAAILFHPQKAWPKERAATTASTPRAVYGAYFAEHIPSAALCGFFAQQAWAGGYLARRRRVYGASIYFPFVVTQPGSIFVLKITEKKGRDKLAQFLRSGLPHAPLAEGAVDWQQSPFVPENGYGRISTHYLSQPEQANLREGVTDVQGAV